MGSQREILIKGFICKWLLAGSFQKKPVMERGLGQKKELSKDVVLAKDQLWTEPWEAQIATQAWFNLR